MELLATHRVSCVGGDKYVRLYHGDLSDIPPREAVDVLVVSAFSSDYVPTSSSLIGALDRKGISVFEISQNKEVDLRANFWSWLSRDLDRFPGAGFRRILCFETPRWTPAMPLTSPATRVGDIFRAIVPFALADLSIRSIAMPLLAAGNQGYDSAVMLSAIFEAAHHWLASGLPVNVIKLVVFEGASVARLQTLFETLSCRQTETVRDTGAQPREAPLYHLFMSYAHLDAAAVDVLVANLRTARPGLRVFQDTLEINPGLSWQAEIDSALESCQRVITVYSPAYLASPVCIEEFNMARLRHRESPTPVLFPIYLRTVAQLPLYMKMVQHVDCREADLARLAAAAAMIAANWGLESP